MNEFWSNPLEIRITQNHVSADVGYKCSKSVLHTMECRSLYLEHLFHNLFQPTSEQSPATFQDSTTSGEERLAQKLKTIDSVTSPRSSFDVQDEDNREIRRPTVTPVTEARVIEVQSSRSFARSSSSAFAPAFTPASRVAPRMSTTSIVNRYGVPVTLPERVTLVVDGMRFVADPQLFLKMPDTMLGRFVISLRLLIF